MNHQEIVKQKFFTHKGKFYKVVRAVRTKSTVTNSWFIGIEYEALYDCLIDEEEWNFVRTISDFLENFKPVAADDLLMMPISNKVLKLIRDKDMVLFNTNHLIDTFNCL